MSAGTTRRQALAFAATLGAAAVLAEVAKPRRLDAARAKQALEDIFPRAFGDWRADDRGQLFVQPRDDQGRLYGVYDQVLQRAYMNPPGEQVMLCVAYGSEQSPALQVHRPEICYAASGFTVRAIESAALGAGAAKLPAIRLHASMVGRSEPVTYWTVLGDTVVSNGSDFRWRQLIVGLRREIRDGMLVRVSSLDRDAEQGYRLHARFVSALWAGMRLEYRGRVFGASAQG